MLALLHRKPCSLPSFDMERYVCTHLAVAAGVQILPDSVELLLFVSHSFNDSLVGKYDYIA